MLGSEILDVAIGLVFVYLILSLVCSSVREGIESWMKTRAIELHRGIAELLGDARPPKGSGAAAKPDGGQDENNKNSGQDENNEDGGQDHETGRSPQARPTKLLYEHPLIRGLFAGEYDDAVRARPRWGARYTLPSYIPARSFALAVLDLAGRGPATADAATSNRLTARSIRASVGKLENPVVQRAVLVALDTAQDDITKAVTEIEKWYDGAMDRVSGVYKRKTQVIIFVIALVTAILANADTIAIVRALYVDDVVRDALVARAGATVEELRDRGDDAEDATARPGANEVDNADETETSQTPVNEAPSNGTERNEGAGRSEAGGVDTTSGVGDPLTMDIGEAKEKLSVLGLPIGWTFPEGADWCGRWRIFRTAVPGALLGWLLTAFALTLGAPFWFDVLNKFMVVRSTVKPHEKSPEEASEDRQRKGPATLVIETTPAKS